MTHCINSATISGNLKFQNQCPGAYIYTRKECGRSMAALGIVHTFRVCDRGQVGVQMHTPRAAQKSAAAPQPPQCLASAGLFIFSSTMKAEQFLVAVLVCLSLMSSGHARPSQLVTGHLCLLLCDLTAHIPGSFFLLGNFILSLAFLALCFFFSL